MQPLYDGVTANLAIPACLAQLGWVVAQMGDGRLGIGAEQQGKARLDLLLAGLPVLPEQVDHGVGLDRPADPQGGIRWQAANVVYLLIHHLAPLFVVKERRYIPAASLQHLQYLLPAEAADALLVGPGEAQRMEIPPKPGQLAIDLQGDDTGQGTVHQLELLVPPARRLHHGLEGELVRVDLLDDGGQLPSAGGRKAQPAGQTVGRLGGAAGAGAVVLKGGEGGGQGRLAREIAHLDGLDGLMLFPLGHGREGIDMSLQQVELAQLPGKACQRRFQQGHLLTQGGGGGKGVHRQILCVCRSPVQHGVGTTWEGSMINHCINNHTSMMAGCQVSGATLTMGVTWGHPAQVACSYLFVR